jgi:hypothetical protein
LLQKLDIEYRIFRERDGKEDSVSAEEDFILTVAEQNKDSSQHIVLV